MPGSVTLPVTAEEDRGSQFAILLSFVSNLVTSFSSNTGTTDRWRGVSHASVVVALLDCNCSLQKPSCHYVFLTAFNMIVKDRKY